MSEELKRKMEQAIGMFLRQSTEHCKYKRDHIPAGWAHVFIDETVADIVKIVETCIRESEAGVE